MRKTLLTVTAIVLAAFGIWAPATPALPAAPPTSVPPASPEAAQSSDRVVSGRPEFLHASTADSFDRGAVVAFGQFHYVSYQRTHAGIPVVGGDFVMVVNSFGQVVAHSVAQQRAIGSLPTKPTLSTEQAEKIAASKLTTLEKVEGTTLVVYALGSEPARLAWESIVAGTGSDGRSRLSVYLDAHSGAVIATREHVMRGSGTAGWNGPNPVSLRTTQSGATFLLSDPSTANMPCQDSANKTTFSGPDDLWGNGNATVRETGCVDALYGAERERDMLSQWLGRNGMNGSGGAWPIRVGLNDLNAFYDGTQVQIGHNTVGQWIGAIDIIAHEMGHGIDDTTPGGISNNGTQEFIADVFGAATEWYINEPAPFDVPDFLVGEQVNLVGSGPIRNMYNPSALGDPNCYSSSIPNTEVHAAAGPGNHWFYLLAMGSDPSNGQPPSPTCNGIPVTGAVGVRNALRILYGAMLMKNSGSSYLRYRTWTLQSARDLDGTCALFNTVKAAWNAVSVPTQSDEPTCDWTEVPGGGATLSAPAGASDTTNGQQLFVRGTNDRIYLNRNSTGWAEVPGNGTTQDAPAAAPFGGFGRVCLFVRGGFAIHVNQFNGTSWTGWSQVPGGGATLSAPTATQLAGYLYTFVRGTNDRIYLNRYNGISWTGWSEVPGNGITQDAPAAASFGGNLYLFVRGGSAIFVNRFNGTSWTGWSQVPGGGATPSAPAAATISGSVNVLVRGTDDHVHLNRFNGSSWSGWGYIAGNTTTAPGATGLNNRLTGLIRGLDNRILFNNLTS